MVTISPPRVEELGALDDNLSELDARAGVNLTSDDIDPGAEAKDKTVVIPVENKVATGQQDLAWRGHGNGGLLGRHCHSDGGRRARERRREAAGDRRDVRGV